MHLGANDEKKPCDSFCGLPWMYICCGTTGAAQRTRSPQRDNRYTAELRFGFKVCVWKFYRAHRYLDLSQHVGGIARRPQILFSDHVDRSANATPAKRKSNAPAAA